MYGLAKSALGGLWKEEGGAEWASPHPLSAHSATPPSFHSPPRGQYGECVIYKITLRGIFRSLHLNDRAIIEPWTINLPLVAKDLNGNYRVDLSGIFQV